jgi:hypothetical protein
VAPVHGEPSRCRLAGGDLRTTPQPLVDLTGLLLGGPKLNDAAGAELYWAVHEARYPARPGDDVPEGKVYDSMEDLLADLNVEPS